jgi:anaerobic selenocysteine-containing dehydrogenase
MGWNRRARSRSVPDGFSGPNLQPGRISAAIIRRLARGLAAAPSAAVYGRTGTCTQEFGTVASWLVGVLNVLTGNLDSPGSVMFPEPAAGAPNTLGSPRYGRATRIGRWRSRVRGLPETFGELPVACLAEEIETPGQGQVRALITIAGNPALSAPNSGRLQRTLASLELLVDFMLRAGPHLLTLDTLLENPHRVDLGPLEPRLPEVLRTPSGTVELVPEALVADVERLRASLARTHVEDDGALVLIERRHLRSNNFWMHNIETLAKGKARCTLQVNPADASRIGLKDGSTARVSSRTGTLVAPVEVTDAVTPGVVSLPLGWGHDLPGVAMAVARAHPGVNSNLLADDERYDELSGNAVVNGIPVKVTPAESNLPA